MPRLDKIFLRHLAPCSSWPAQSRAGLLAVWPALPARARGRRPALLPASFFIGRFAPRRLSLPSTPDGSPPPFFRWSLCSPAC